MTISSSTQLFSLLDDLKELVIARRKKPTAKQLDDLLEQAGLQQDDSARQALTQWAMVLYSACIFGGNWQENIARLVASGVPEPKARQVILQLVFGSETSPVLEEKEEPAPLLVAEPEATKEESPERVFVDTDDQNSKIGLLFGLAIGVPLAILLLLLLL